MKIPVTLKHKPVITCENYEQVDGRSAYSSEAKGLSLGLAQWNERGKIDVAAKVWRYTGEKWSRQSEELPLHRVLDLSLLIVQSILHLREAYRHPDLFDHENRNWQDRHSGDALRMGVWWKIRAFEDIKLFRDALAKTMNCWLKVSRAICIVRKPLEETIGSNSRQPGIVARQRWRATIPLNQRLPQIHTSDVYRQVPLSRGFPHIQNCPQRSSD